MTDGRVRPEIAAPQNVKLAKNLVARFPDAPPSDKVRPHLLPFAHIIGRKDAFECICVCGLSRFFFVTAFCAPIVVCWYRLQSEVDANGSCVPNFPCCDACLMVFWC